MLSARSACWAAGGFVTLSGIDQLRSEVGWYREPVLGDPRRHRFPPDIMAHAVWLYFRLALSFRDIEELIAARGVIVSYDAIRVWCTKFGASFAAGWPTPEQERRRRRFKSKQQAQRFVSVYNGVTSHFRPRRQLLSASRYRAVRKHRFRAWNRVTQTTALEPMAESQPCRFRQIAAHSAGHPFTCRCHTERALA